MTDDQQHGHIHKHNEGQDTKIAQNARQIALLEAEMRALKSDLIGVTGRNGLRGEFRAYKQHADAQMKEVISSLGEVKRGIGAWIKWTVGIVIAAAGAIIAAAQWLGG